jgi:hypothetical protein
MKYQDGQYRVLAKYKTTENYYPVFPARSRRRPRTSLEECERWLDS